ncbi:MAG: acyl-CoA dehydrogenase family protein [Actinomycetota bacterium]
MTVDAEVADRIVEAVARWVDDEVVPNASRFELADEFPHDMVEQMKAFGLFGCVIPAEHGGLGLDHLTYARLIEEISRGFMSLGGVLNSHLIVSTMIARFGTKEQKEQWLPDLATGTKRACFSLSEHDAGSDTRSMRCRAEPDGDQYVINGTKMWVTNGMRARIIGLMAKTPDDKVTCFIVDKEPGLTWEAPGGGTVTCTKVEKLGYRGLETMEMHWDNVRIPAANMLGDQAGMGRGLNAALSALELGRINIAARAVGVARASFEAAMDYSQRRETFGKPIYDHQVIAFKLADMATKLEAARLMCHSAATKFDEGVRADMEAGMAKLFCSEVAAELALESMRIHGGNGYTPEYPVERYYRDVPLMIIGEGTSEIQKLVIARQLRDKYRVD